MPTLLLAYLLEPQFTKPSDDAPRSVATLFISGAVGLTLVGEFLALRGLLGHGGAWSARLVVFAIGVLCTLIISVMLDHARQNLPNAAEIDRHPLLSGWLGCTSTLAALIVTFLPVVAAIWLAFDL